MTKPRCLAGVTALLLGLPLGFACTSDDTPAGTETGTDTQTETETGTETETETGDECTPDGVYGDCGSDGEGACMAGSQSVQCLTDSQSMPSIGVCARRCEDVCDCWAAPDDGDAPVACKALVAGDDDRSCVLDCSAGQTCPGGMTCLDSLGICVFPVD
jgi:hypothetical protein